MALTQIYTVVTSDAAVSNLISSRLYPMRMPREAALPAAVYQLITTAPVNSLDGDNGLDLLRVQITAWAANYTAAKALASAIRNALIAAGSLKLTTEDVRDTQDPETHNYGVIMQFSVWSTFDGDAVSSIREFQPYEFTGNGVATQFTFPTAFRTGSLLLFKNGLPMKSENYTILTGNTGISITPAPAGGTYPDEFLAYYAKE